MLNIKVDFKFNTFENIKNKILKIQILKFFNCLPLNTFSKFFKKQKPIINFPIKNKFFYYPKKFVQRIKIKKFFSEALIDFSFI